MRALLAPKIEASHETHMATIRDLRKKSDSAALAYWMSNGREITFGEFVRTGDFTRLAEERGGEDE